MRLVQLRSVCESGDLVKLFPPLERPGGEQNVRAPQIFCTVTYGHNQTWCGALGSAIATPAAHDRPQPGSGVTSRRLEAREESGLREESGGES